MHESTLKKVLSYVATSVLALALLCYIAYHIVSVFTGKLETETVPLVTVLVEDAGDGYLFRTQSLVSAKEQGSVSYLAEDGEKVGAGQSIANVYQVTDGAVTAQIEQLDEQIAILKESALSGITADTTTVDRKISQLQQSIRKSTDSGNYEYAQTLERELQVQLNRRALILAQKKNYSDEIFFLMSERAKLTESLGAYREVIAADTASYFFRGTDGYESLFSADTVSSLTVSSFLGLTEAQPAPSANAIGTLVSDCTWYVALPVDRAAAAMYTVKAKYNVTFPHNDDTTLSMALSRILSESGSDTSVLIFETDLLPAGFSYDRSQPVKIEQSEISGIRIPASALRVIDGETGVYIQYGTAVRFKKVEILRDENGAYLVADLSEGKASSPYLRPNDSVITQGKDLYDGKIIS